MIASVPRFLPEHLDGWIPWSGKLLSIAVLQCCSYAVGVRLLFDKRGVALYDLI